MGEFLHRYDSRLLMTKKYAGYQIRLAGCLPSLIIIIITINSTEVIIVIINIIIWSQCPKKKGTSWNIESKGSIVYEKKGIMLNKQREESFLVFIICNVCYFTVTEIHPRWEKKTQMCLQASTKTNDGEGLLNKLAHFGCTTSQWFLYGGACHRLEANWASWTS